MHDGRSREGDVSAGDSDGYRSDSSGDSDRYQLPNDPELAELIEGWKKMREGWWNQAGYETYWDYLEESEKSWARMGFA